MNEEQRRRSIVSACREMNRSGLNQGTSGNISLRAGGDMLVTPSGVDYDSLGPEMIARMPLDRPDGTYEGPCKPSSEWLFHRDIYRARPDVGAVVHAHATYATVFSMLRRPIPAVHYMIAAFGGPKVLCTDYAPYGTAELSGLVIEGLGDRHAVLLGSHGMIAVGADLATAMWRAVELETLARMAYLAMAVGQPVVLPDDEIARTVERFRSYGPQAQAGAARK